MRQLSSGSLWLGRSFLIAALVLAPWLSHDANSHFWLCLCLLPASVCVLASRLLAPSEPGENATLGDPAVLTLFLFIVLGIVQLVPVGSTNLGTRKLGLDSRYWTQAHELEKEELKPHAALEIQTQTLTFDPASTRFRVAQFTLILGLLLIVPALFNKPDHIYGLFALIAINASAVAMWGIAQKIRPGGDALAFPELAQHFSPFGTFVNRNNAGGYFNLCIAAWIAFTVRAYHKLFRSLDDSQSGFNQPFQRSKWNELLAVDRDRCVSLFTGMMILAGLIATASRGAIGACGLGVTILLVLLVAYRHAIVATALGGFMGFLAILLAASWGQSTKILNRVGEFSWSAVANDLRFKNWADVVHMIPDFPFFGTGWGTYYEAYRPYQTFTLDVRFRHPENQYLEVAIEAGLIGAACLLIGLIRLGVKAFRATGRPPTWMSLSAILCLTFALVTQGVQAFVDFGLMRPAGFLTFAAVYAAGRGLLGSVSANDSRGQSSPRLRKRDTAQHLVALSYGIFVVTGLVISANEFYLASRVEAVTSKRIDFSDPDFLSINEVATRIEALEAALEQRRDDAHGHLHLAELYHYRFRKTSAMALSDVERDDWKGQNWNRTGWLETHRAILQLRDTGRIDTVEDSESGKNLLTAQKHLLLAREACPLQPYVAWRLAALYDLNRQPRDIDKQQLLVEACSLMPTNPQDHMIVGQLAWDDGYDRLAFAAWKTYLRYDASSLHRVVSTVKPYLDDEEIMKNIIPREEICLTTVATLYRNFGDYDSLSQLAKNRLLVHYDKQGLEVGETALLQERLSFLKTFKAWDKAETVCGELIIRNPLNAGYHKEMTEVLLNRAKFQEAKNHAAIALKLDPDSREVRQLRERILKAERGQQP